VAGVEETLEYDTVDGELMRVLLVWPNRAGFGFKPIGLALLSALLKRNGHEVRLFDTTHINLRSEGLSTARNRIRIFKPVDTSGKGLDKQPLDLRQETISTLEDFRPEVVGVSALSDEVPVGLEISAIVKEWNPDIPVVWGNKAATMAPDKILAQAVVDFVCLGEGFEFITNFMDAVSNKLDVRLMPNLAWRDDLGQVHRNPVRPECQNLDALPFLDWSIFDHRHFLKPFDGRLYTGGDHMIYWGCPYSCTYCINEAYRALYREAGGSSLRRYGVERVIDELRFLVDRWGVTFFKYHDEDFCLKPLQYFRTLAAEYQRHVGVPFSAMANARNITIEKVALLKQMNCASVSIGIETANQHLRQDILKRRETREQIVRAVHMLNDAGIRTCGFNMLGIPHETRESIMETIALNREARVDCPDTGFFYPLEGTELYDVSIDEGLFDPSADMGYDDVNPSLHLPGISHDELVALRERFVLYVKLPADYLPYVGRSEVDDEVGRSLTESLLRIYDESVLMNNGRWDSTRRVEDDLSELHSLANATPVSQATQ